MTPRILIAAGAALLLGACTIGPDYVRPAAPVPQAWKAPPEGWKYSEPADALPRAGWWQAFGDATLDALVARLQAGNLSIVAAEARYRQAQAVLRQLQAGSAPAVVGSGGATRSRLSSSSAGTSRNWDLGVDAAWEPDLWGRVRRSVEAGTAAVQATAADVESVRLSAIAALAQSYLALRVVDAQARLLEQTESVYARSLTLTRNRYNVGVVGKVDVAQAETQLKSTQVQLTDLLATRAQLENAIAVLLGEPPSNFSLPRAAAVPGLPAVPAGLPSELLERRPDIASAERGVAEANARIGAAQAALYPSVTLSAGAALRSATLADLLAAPARFWSLGAAAAQLLFDGGAREAVVDQARAAYDAQVAGYRQTVLTAFQEVEDSLALLRVLERESQLQAEALAAARESLRLTTNRYEAGTASFLEVVVVQAIALNNERNAVALLGRQLAATVSLVRALGGGWDAGSLPNAAAAAGAPSKAAKEGR